MESQIRDYELLDKVNNLFRSIRSERELKMAVQTIHTIAKHLHEKHFIEQNPINIRSLVKTFSELDEIGIEILYHNLTQNT